ncbi:MAG: hypothetical protein Hyperionvirus1_45 [Hyperionvirus sp.]|uniref:Uncharacterized protein n=1 Tax=Hyperionvirus sp. TaxID=2487770 RepID=A0A3G5A5E7_9VIRU|nr:MAG: hypothetical protein Hyperionvirus1_45 [Hyperionvirus sp.]
MGAKSSRQQILIQRRTKLQEIIFNYIAKPSLGYLNKQFMKISTEYRDSHELNPLIEVEKDFEMMTSGEQEIVLEILFMRRDIERLLCDGRNCSKECLLEPKILISFACGEYLVNPRSCSYEFKKIVVNELEVADDWSRYINTRTFRSGAGARCVTGYSVTDVGREKYVYVEASPIGYTGNLYIIGGGRNSDEKRNRILGKIIVRKAQQYEILKFLDLGDGRVFILGIGPLLVSLSEEYPFVSTFMIDMESMGEVLSVRSIRINTPKTIFTTFKFALKMEQVRHSGEEKLRIAKIIMNEYKGLCNDVALLIVGYVE